MKKDFEACPFCGNHDQMWFCIITCEDGENSVRCGKCNADGPSKRHKTEAVRAWNARAKELAE